MNAPDTPATSDPSPQTSGWKADLLRAALLVVCSSILGLTANALSPHPVPVFDPAGPGARPDPAPRIGVEAYRALLESRLPILVDARSDHLFKEGVPLGAFRLRPETFAAQFPNIAPYLAGGDETGAPAVIVLCDSADCPTSDIVVKLLAEAGHPGAKVLEGGWPAYRAAGLPLEGGE